MAAGISKAVLYWNTVRWLRLSQLFWQLYRRLRPVINPPPLEAEGMRGRVLVNRGVSTPAPEIAELRFLNEAVPADPGALDWHPADKSRLWRYNLHYFDYLQWRVIGPDLRGALIDSWLEHNPTGCEDAWEPYTVSLRIVNWLKCFSRRDRIPQDWQSSLFNQANWLAHNLEYHILANHFLKNAKALLFAGVAFTGPRGGDWLRQGRQLFLEQLAEQFLDDGGHYERSPMYHCIALEDCLDALNLMQSNPTLFAAADIQEVRAVAVRGLDFLDSVLAADGRIPLFNDAAFGIAPEPSALLEYGAQLTGYTRRAPARLPVRVACHDSGYFGYRLGGDSLLIDCGRIGPDYQPGHAHCDMLSYELCVDGFRLIVDPGVHGYDDDDTRHYLRSTAAHNTVEINGEEQSEIWGTFRVARRARPVKPQLSQLESDGIVFRGGHDGYRRLSQRVTHRREVQAEFVGRWSVNDTIEGRGAVEATSHIHFAPGIRLEDAGDGVFNLLRTNDVIARLIADNADATEVLDTYTAFGFGNRQAALALRLRRAGELPFELGYRIERATPAGG